MFLIHEKRPATFKAYLLELVLLKHDDRARCGIGCLLLV